MLLSSVLRALHVSACVCTEHISACVWAGHVMYLLVSASIKGCGCIAECIQWLVSAHTQSGACICILLACSEEMSMSLHFWLLSRAANLSAFVGLYGQLSVCLHVFAHVESWICIFI